MAILTAQKGTYTGVDREEAALGRVQTTRGCLGRRARTAGAARRPSPSLFAPHLLPPAPHAGRWKSLSNKEFRYALK